MNSSTEPLAEAEFRRRLIQAAESWPIEETRFYQALSAGRCPRSMLRTYAQAVFASASMFCATLAHLIEQAPDHAARGGLLLNLIGEEGIFVRGGVGLVSRPEQSHPALAMRFLEACGGAAADFDRQAAMNAHAGPGVGLVREGRWLEAVSYFFVGQEYKFATVSQRLFELFRKHGLAERDLAFFAVHGVADQEHGEQALDLVIAHAHSRAEQEAALAAAEAGARHWFELNGGSPRHVAA